MKTSRKQTGFTIVELLIVIVVIAILAAITIVAYNGIQSRAKLSSAQSTASTVAKKAEAWNALNNSYPTYCQFATGTTNGTGTATGVGAAGCTAGATATGSEAKLDDPNYIAIAGSVTSGNGVNTVQYIPCGTAPHTGARIHFWNYTAATPAITAATGTTPASMTVGTGC